MAAGLASVASLVREAAGGLLDALLPQTCASCDRWIPADQSPTCPDCRAAIEIAQATPYCSRCGRTCSPLAAVDKSCPQCRTEQFWNIAGVARVGVYSEESLRRPLVGLKFTGGERQADLLGGLLADALHKKPWVEDIETLVPVPMHRLRRWQRPCDHALMLAEAVSRRLRIPVRRAAIQRVRYSRSQTRTISRNARFENVKDCFGPARKPNIAGRTVCIIDNLLVTGATVHEVSKVLRRSGAKRIYAAVVARSSLPGEPQPEQIEDAQQTLPAHL